MATFSTRLSPIDRLMLWGTKLGLSEERFKEVALQAEKEHIENPSSYDRKVLLFGISVYIYMLLVLGIYTGLSLAIIYFLATHHAGYLGIKIAIFLVVPLCVIFKSFDLKLPPPPGIELNRKQAPELFALVDELSTYCKTPVHHVYINDQVNASVSQRPLYGFLGMHRNYLNIGLPLMLLQRPECIKAVIAHELGHLSGNHSKRNAWVYKLNMRWANIIDNLEGQLLSIPLTFYYHWATSRFSAMTLSLCRRQELEADLTSTQIAGVHNTVNALLTLPIALTISKYFWSTTLDKRKTSADAPQDVYHRLANMIGKLDLDMIPEGKEKSLRSEILTAMKEMLDDPGSVYETHPPLKTRTNNGLFETDLELTEEGLPTGDRLRILFKPFTKEESAAGVYLKSILDQLLTELSNDWFKSESEAWTAAYNYFQAQMQRLQEIEMSLAKRPIEEKLEEKLDTVIDLLHQKASLILEIHNFKRALPIYEQILQHNDVDPVANYNIGIFKLGEKDDSGIVYLEKAAAHKITLLPDAYANSANYLALQNKEDEAKIFEDKLADYKKRFESSASERTKINERCTFYPCGFSERQVENLRSFFADLPHVYRLVQLVKMHLHTFPEYPFYVLAIDLQSKYNTEADRMAVAGVIRENLAFSSDYTLIMHDMFTRKLMHRLEEIPESLIYKAQ